MMNIKEWATQKEYIYVYKLYSHMHKGRRNGSERGGGESGESERWREAGIEMGSG